MLVHVYDDAGPG